ncbi:MAG: UvrD-helicase domain-containing protein [Clostridia bacterium]|nr:UvrD-helicase domain-containing protein [Clostridia bacterium]
MDNQSFLECRRRIMARDFSRMNAPQQQAVFQTEGPVLILAGAGSGKTTVLVNRIANMVRYGTAYHSEQIPAITAEQADKLRRCAEGDFPLNEEIYRLCAVNPCPAWRILAITFTNKAAGELKARLTAMLGEQGGEVMAGTFHSFCARILRTDGAALGYSAHFTIYDTDDSRRLMKECMKSLNIEERVLGHKTILAQISRAKDSLLSPSAFAEQVGADFRLKKVAACYELYQKRLREADAMDFDDLLSRTVELFETDELVLQKYQNRFRYIMVDEYQDTNHAQYRLVSLLAQKSGNLCVVGDDDQSIYKFRGATIENILSFEDEFSGCTVIRLEQNYRSSQNILDAANAVIAQNTNRKGKTLWTQNGKGDLLQLHTLENADAEGRFIAQTVLDKVATGAFRYNDFAVLYRANTQSNAIESALVKSGVPYRIFGGHRFNDTKEVRDAVAYLRVLNNPDDSVSLRRIINEPKRGIGDTTLDKAAALAEQQGLSLYTVLSHADEYGDLSRSASKILPFIHMMDELREKVGELTLPKLYEEMLQKTGYLAMWQAMGEAEATRVDNLNELASSLISYEENCEDLPQLSGFLEENALMTDIDNYDTSADAMVLMTMHAAKGLEFPVVFLPGFEDGIFPGMQTMFRPDELEEDRRLCYVAITRAKQELYITNAESRMLYGSTTRNAPSRFLADIPTELTEEHKAAPRYRYGGFGGGFSSSSSWGGSTYSSFDTPTRKAPATTAKVGIGGGISASSKKTTADVWNVGDVVSHKTFGTGTITAVQPMGGDTLLTIQFDKAGLKKLMATFAKLKKE